EPVAVHGRELELTRVLVLRRNRYAVGLNLRVEDGLPRERLGIDLPGGVERNFADAFLDDRAQQPPCGVEILAHAQCPLAYLAGAALAAIHAAEEYGRRLRGQSLRLCHGRA